MSGSCPFCSLPEHRILHATEHWLIIRDGFPVSLGHSLVIPRRHVNSLFGLSEWEHLEFFKTLDWAKKQIDEEYAPVAYNIGVNDGPVAGQTVAHLHVHLIPRYEGDVEDPRGGVRWIMPSKAKYW